ncbi:hypothetical protein GQF42_04790 [Streptomyces broussonetiae]|uniref:Uncharacterized protein n=1 Tax=Streptomyces broussonetiae TaxID=2686304 RepID=A0A6I6MWS1_9ACTN|nr:hypothetical protein [Streptomyces broussonetiae]QHA02691.1 hypothetical protein GQF42_04790 [Streptomyces broussonetiae]
MTADSTTGARAGARSTCRLTALFASDDRTALGALRAVQETGPVSHDGIDDIPEAAHVLPR